MSVEFPRPISLDTIGEAPREVAIEADEAERAALARRFELVAINTLSATVSLSRNGPIINATGRFRAEVIQTCVATGAPLPAKLDEPFVLRFVPELAPGEDEVELSSDDCDTIEYQGGAVDVGEAVAETMALALDPFPRSPDADAVLKEAGVLGEGETGPFAALKALKDKMGG